MLICMQRNLDKHVFLPPSYCIATSTTCGREQPPEMEKLRDPTHPLAFATRAARRNSWLAIWVFASAPARLVTGNRCPSRWSTPNQIWPKENGDEERKVACINTARARTTTQIQWIMLLNIPYQTKYSIHHYNYISRQRHRCKHIYTIYHISLYIIYIYTYTVCS